MNIIEQYLEDAITSRIKEMYDEDLCVPADSEAVTIACELFYTLIADILSHDTTDACMGAVEALRAGVFKGYGATVAPQVRADISYNVAYGE